MSEKKSQKSQDKTHKKKKSKGDLKGQIKKLGGTEDDFDLVQGAGDGSAGDNDVPVDPKLTSDVAGFLKDLGLGGSTASKSSSKKGKDKAKSKPSEAEASSSVPKDKSSVKDKSKSKDTSSSAPKKSHPKKQNEKQPPESAPPRQKITFNTDSNSKPKSRYNVQPTSLWYTSVPALPPTPSLSLPTPTQLSSLSQKASNLYNADVTLFASSSSSSSSETGFLSKMIQSGTLSDRLSALTLLVQSSPLHNPKALETLKGMSERGKGKGGREESLKALRCIIDWWVGGGAPDRKLKYFRDQPLLHSEVTDAHLVVWHYEDWLKKYFFSILQTLETFSLDPLAYVRTQSLRLLSTLLKDKPEQEQNLLRLLVNKLGDTDKSICSRASHHILQVLQSHPAMKGVIVGEMVNLVFKSAASGAKEAIAGAAAHAASTSVPSEGATEKRRIKFSDTTSSAPSKNDSAKKKAKTGSAVTANTHARYYATITFNQIVLTPSKPDRDVALKLIEVYFELFKEILGTSTLASKPADDDVDEEEELKTDKKGRILSQRAKKGKEKESTRGAAGFAEVEDQNSKLVSAILTGVNRAVPFARNTDALSNHIDTLFLITHKSTFNVSVQALLLLQQIACPSTSAQKSAPQDSSAKSVTDRFYRTLYTSLLDPRLAQSNKQAMYLNLLFKSIKADPSPSNERQKAFVRRFTQVLVSGAGMAASNEFVVGGLCVLGEVFATVPGLRGWLRGATSSDNGASTDSAQERETSYDPLKRDPQYAHAGASPLWELTPLLNHYHPTVALHAHQLLTGQPLTSTPDLSLNTLSHFLDRFVFKNPKSSKKSADDDEGGGKEGGGSLMQSNATQAINGGVLKTKGEKVEKAVNEQKWDKMKLEDVKPDEVFYHRYFSAKVLRGKKGEEDEEEEEDKWDGVGQDGASEDEARGEEEEDEGEEMDLTGDEAEATQTDPIKAGNPANADSDEEEDEDGNGLDEDEIWAAMKASMPAAEGEGDSDLLLSDSDADIDDEEEDDETLAAMAAQMSDSDLSAGEDEDQSSEGEDGGQGDGDEDGLAEDSDDLLPVDGDGLIQYDGSDYSPSDEEEEWGGIADESESKSKKRKRDEQENKKNKKARKSLPTFASYEDYAKMIEEGPEDDI